MYITIIHQWRQRSVEQIMFGADMLKHTVGWNVTSQPPRHIDVGWK